MPLGIFATLLLDQTHHFEVLVAFGFAEAEGAGVLEKLMHVFARFDGVEPCTLRINVMPLDGYTGAEQK
jgi:hypothetical protein